MQIIKSIRVMASIEKTWQVLGPNYTRAGDWASSVYASAPRTGVPTLPDAPSGGRVCQTSIGEATETILKYDPSSYTIAYNAHADKMPGFVKGIENTWQLSPISDTETQVEITFNMQIAAPFNILMGWMMRMQMKGLLNESLEDFKHFVETGQPHPRKVKSNQSKKAMAVIKVGNAA